MNRWLFLALLAIAAFGLRVGFTAWYRGSLELVPEQRIAGSDGVEYDLLARNLSKGYGYCWSPGNPTSFRAPGFPMVLAMVYSTLGDSYTTAYLFLALLGTVGVLSTYVLARELCGESWARWAAVLTAVYPPDIYAASYFFSEVVFAPCLGFGLFAMVRHVRSGQWYWATIAGVLLGYAALTRSFGLLFLPTFMLYLMGNPLRRTGWLAAFCFCIGFLTVITPWVVRNYLVHHEFVAIATNGGSTFYGANNPLTSATLKEHGNWIPTTRLPGRDLIDAQPNEVAHDKMEYKLGRDWVVANPGSFVKLAVFKVVRFWLPFVQWPSMKVYPVANIVLTAPFLILIGIGLMRTLSTRQSRVQYAVLHLTMVVNMAMVVLFWGDPRFRDANTPMLMIYAVAGGHWIGSLRQPSSTNHSPA